MEIRPYHPDDDAALIAIERQSPRGFPEPFVHFRRRFVERAELYPQYLTLIAEDGGQIIGMSSIIVKEAYLGGELVKMAYSFDSRVLPTHRKKGIGLAMLNEKLRWAKQQGAAGAYSLIVATNQASLHMVEKAGYQKVRMILYLQFQPFPLFIPPALPIQCDTIPTDQERIQAAYARYDFFVPNIADKVRHLEFQRLSTPQGIGLSVYNQALVYCQIPADAPYPQSDEEAARLGRNWQVFDVVGMHQNADELGAVFSTLRDQAVSMNVNKITWQIDRNERVPHFMMDESHLMIDYWLMYKSFDGNAPPQWSDSVYLDPRDL